MDTETAPLPQVVFRGKKRKAYRQRAEAEDEPTPTPHASTTIASKSTRDNTPSVPQPLSASPDAAVQGGEGDASATTATAAAAAAATATAAVAKEEEEDEEVGLSVAEVLRLRNLRRSKLGGVKFSANDALTRGAGDAPAEEQQQEGMNDELSLMIREEESRVLERSRTTAAAIADAGKRFAPQTGLSGELINKHMRHSPAAATATQRDQSSSSSDNNQQQPPTNTKSTDYHQPGSSSSKLTATKPLERQPALQGELMEVDLGEEARSRNEAMTERARRRLLGEDVGDDYDGKEDARPTKARLGRDGKPWRPRNRRGSDAVKRDQIVEEILRENRLDVYDTPAPPPGTTATSTPAAGTGAEASGEGAADDRIAEEFRREFMEAMAQRQQQRRKKQQPPASSAAKPGAKKDEDVLRGPKLGGSRNARAAMRDLLLKEQEKEKEKGRLGGAGAGGARRGGRR
ncbi:hypothetical protein DL764_010185 [Monosporascus ibericus]|uniref:Uncharacterized protein n=1 Tax=Monosporascus ibericus TaxID=155417 RepID=A0A4Q4SUY9_9PEZI|nr:hypothetical protein DL764_010185 [Monosporascus ibericus]